MTKLVKIAVVDDHPLVREGVVRIIDETPGFEIVAQGATAEEAIDLARRRCPDIVVLDLSIPGGGREALRGIKELCPDTRVMILTVSSEEEDVCDLLAMGANGYVLKGTTGDELVYSLRMLQDGGQYVMPSLAAKMLATAGLNRRAVGVTTLDQLSERERSIATKVGSGLSNKGIGAALDLSEKTVKHYLTIIFKKIRVSNRLALAVWVQAQMRLTESHLVASEFREPAKRSSGSGGGHDR